MIGVGEEITIKVSSLSGIRLPEEGIASNSLIPTISTDALAGGRREDPDHLSAARVFVRGGHTRGSRATSKTSARSRGPPPRQTLSARLCALIRLKQPLRRPSRSSLYRRYSGAPSGARIFRRRHHEPSSSLASEVTSSKRSCSKAPTQTISKRCGDPVRGDLSMLVLAELPEEELISVTIPIDKNFIIIPEDGLPQGSLETPSVVLTIEIPDEIATLIAVTAGIGKLADTTLSYTTCPIGPGKPLAACPECDGVLSCPCRTPGAPTQLSFSLKNSMRLVPETS